MQKKPSFTPKRPRGRRRIRNGKARPNKYRVETRVVSISLYHTELALIDRVCRAKGCTRSELIRRALDPVLADGGDPNTDEPRTTREVL